MGPASVPAEGDPLRLTVRAEGPGFLSVVARCPGGQDIRLTVTDPSGQPLLEGSSDIDWGGDVGAEQLIVQIPGAGTYAVLVETFGWAPAAIEIGGTFLPSQLAHQDPDPDGSPDGARALSVGESWDDRIDPQGGDPWDWFSITPDQSGVLTVLTRSGEGDLILEAFEQGAYRDNVDRSDQDQGGETGNETVTMTVEAGQTVYFKVVPWGSSGVVNYRIASGLVPSG
jgi:hypothetical protein